MMIACYYFCMHLPHHHHSLHYLEYMNTIKGRLVASLSIRDFVSSMMSLFIPVYLYSFGYSVTFIAAFYVAYFSIGICSYRLVAYVISRYGLYHSLFLSYIFLAITSALLTFGGSSVWFVCAALLPLVCSEKFFWTPRHIDVARLFTSGKIMKKTTSKLNTLTIFLSSIAPLFGGLLAAQYGPGIALFTSFVIMLFAIWLLYGEYEKERGERVASTFNLKFKRSMIGNGAMNLHTVTLALLWPLFIFMYVTDFSNIGLIFSITGAVAMLLTYASGNWFNNFPYFKLGVALKTFTIPFRAITSSINTFLAFDFVGSIAVAFMGSRFNARFYNEANDSNDIDSYILSVETAGEIGKLLIWVIVLCFLILGISLKAIFAIAFVVAGMSTLLTPLVGSTKQE